MQISGTTRLVGLLADPIAQVRTPQAFNELFAERGLDAVTVGLHVAPAGLVEAWRGLARLGNLSGFVVSIPHKLDAARLCDVLGPRAALAGTVNAVRREPDGRLIGETFDGEGFLAGLKAEGIDPRGARILRAGAGGAAASIAFALAAAGVAAIDIVNRSAAKAEELAARLKGAFPGLAVSASADGDRPADLIVNATALGLSPQDGLPVDAALIGPGCCVAEALIAPAPTALARAAEARGARYLDGRPMLRGQLMPLLGHILPDHFA